MSAVRYVFYTFLIVAMPHKCCGDELELTKYKWPTTVIAVLVRNKAHTLPYFLTSLYNLDYPKDRLYIWITSDYNQDSSDEILSKWSNKYGEEYNGLNITFDTDSGPLHADEENPLHWSPAHFKHVINLREQALNFSRKIWADFLFMVDADAFFTNTAVLKTLVRKNLDIVAPMLISDGLYSNFWCGMTENYYYKRTDDYKPIVSREQKGCFPVPMVHSSVLVNLRSLKSDHLTYNPNNLRDYNGPEDDIITFAVNAKQNGITLSVCNDQIYGFLPVPLEHDDDPANDYEQLLNIKLEATSKGYSLPLDPLLESYVQYPTMWKFNLDEIYLINLERRTERRKLMEQSFKELGMDAKHFKAVDGRNLDINDLSKFSITLMPNYEDPYHERPMKAGEVGCFLSHYMIWQEIIEKGFNTVLILEDDIHFAPYFRHKLLNLLKEIKSLDWDLVYIGRKILQDSKEVYATPHLVRPLYSYWTLGYLISQRGARKLLDAEPLSKMLPVDEFLPIMFDQHPNATWKSYFTLRDLEAYSVAPLLVHPTHYTGQEGYISDTEDSNVVPLDRLDKNVRIEL